MKREICKAFCDSVKVVSLQNGLGISSDLFEVDGDPASLYALGPDRYGKWRLEDSGSLIPALIASGFDIGNSNRKSALTDILASAGATLNEETLEIESEPVPESELPAKAVQFLSALARVTDLAWLSSERVRNTFREDVKSLLAEMLPKSISMEENTSVDDSVQDLRSDLVFKQAGRMPVALFLAQSDLSLVEAMLLKSEISRMGPKAPRVAAILERENVVSRYARTRAMNRLDSISIYDGDQKQAVTKIVEFISEAPPFAA